jgi:hypothetical protein
MYSNIELRNEIEMLKGNINRLCVSDDEPELFSMYSWASVGWNEYLNCGNMS